MSVKDLADGEKFALKVAKDTSPETRDSFAQEHPKAQTLVRLGLKHTPVVEGGDDSQLMELLMNSASAGGYVGEINPKNLIWDG